MARRLNRGDVHFCRFRAPDKQRPVLILTRDSTIGRLSMVTVAPITSTVRGVPSEVILEVDDGMKVQCAVNLHNAVTVSQERLANRAAALGDERMQEVCAALRFSLGCGWSGYRARPLGSVVGYGSSRQSARRGGQNGGRRVFRQVDKEALRKGSFDPPPFTVPL